MPKYATGMKVLGRFGKAMNRKSGELPVRQSPFFTHEVWGGDYVKLPENSGDLA
jgi:hypothetical protein